MHSTGTARVMLSSVVDDNKGCSDAFNLYTALIFRRASIGSPTHWMVDPLSMMKRLLIMFCNVNR